MSNDYDLHRSNPNHQRFSDGRSAMGQVHVVPHRAAEVIGAALLAGFAAAFGILWTWRDRYRERRMLSALSDHMLKDIGVSRADVEREAGKTFWRP
jgi:uncharacterized protein YjiS (DUF1127 family)